VRRPVLLAEVGLEFDDPSDPTAWSIVSDESAAEQRPPQLERRQGENVPIGAGYRGITVT
jgi:hypothetical protein